MTVQKAPVFPGLSSFRRSWCSAASESPFSTGGLSWPRSDILTSMVEVGPSAQGHRSESVRRVRDHDEETLHDVLAVSPLGPMDRRVSR